MGCRMELNDVGSTQQCLRRYIQHITLQINRVLFLLGVESCKSVRRKVRTCCLRVKRNANLSLEKNTCLLEKCWPKFCKIEPSFECLKDIAEGCEPYGSQKDKSLKLRQEVLDCIDSRKSEIKSVKILKDTGISK